jgi:DNA polymerase IV
MAAPAIIHLDMDAFYASVEQRDDPALRGRPVIVGGHPTRGVVLAASYEVRPFGVRSAMPMGRALQLCPQAMVVPPRFAAYGEVSQQVHAILSSVTPLVEPLSLDEAFLDVSASAALFGSAGDIARRLRGRIADELQLPASAGIAASKFVAKIASDSAKPKGQVEVTEAQTIAFLSVLPVGRLWGVGPKTEAALLQLGLRTIGDLRERGEAWLAARLGDQGRSLHALSLGRDDRPVVPDRQAKSVGAEDTFAEDTLDAELLRLAVHGQAWRVGQRARRSGLRGRVVELKLKDDTFRVTHRRLTLPAPTDDGQLIYRAALDLLSRAAPARALRLTGVSLADFSPPEQPSLFPVAGGRREALNRTLDRISEKFGAQAVTPADLSGTSSPTRITDLRRGSSE